MSSPPGPAGDTRRYLAPAKINPWLRVLARRSDGFHELETVLLALDWCDELTVRRSPEWRVTVAGPCASPDIPADGTNLAARAAALALDFARAAGRAADTAGLDLELHKRIPSQAGLGGGSSDAAAALHATLDLFGLDGTPEAAAFALESLAALGSDTAFFSVARESGLATCTGRGERVAPARAPEGDWALAVVVPEVRCPTAEVYAALEPSPAPARPLDVAGLVGSDPIQARTLLSNDLERAALHAVPELQRWRALLDEVGAEHWRLCGSGSSWFGVHASDTDAERQLALVQDVADRMSLDVRISMLTRPARHGVRRVD